MIGYLKERHQRGKSGRSKVQRASDEGPNEERSRMVGTQPAEESKEAWEGRDSSQINGKSESASK